MWDGNERRNRVLHNYEDCPRGVKHETEILALKECYSAIAKDVKDIKEQLLGRPSWTITCIIAFLSTLAFSALTFAFTILKDGRVLSSRLGG